MKRGEGRMSRRGRVWRGDRGKDEEEKKTMKRGERRLRRRGKTMERNGKLWRRERRG